MKGDIMKIKDNILISVKDNDIKEGVFIIPNSVTSIGAFAFSGCTNLTSKNANYKAFSISNKRFMRLMCRGYFFQENEWSEEIDEIMPCERGYHYCTNLFEIFNYYFGALDKDIAIYICEVGDKIIKTSTSKCVTNKIKPIKRLGREDIIRILNGGDV